MKNEWKNDTKSKKGTAAANGCGCGSTEKKPKDWMADTNDGWDRSAPASPTGRTERS